MKGMDKKKGSNLFREFYWHFPFAHVHRQIIRLCLITAEEEQDEEFDITDILVAQPFSRLFMSSAS